MSDREKKLLVFFALAGFLIVNFLAFDFATKKRAEVDAQSREAKDKLATAESFQERREQITDEMAWLSEHEPEPAADQDVQTTLQQLAENAAKSTGLTVKSQKALPTEAVEGKNYHRAKFQFVVTGTEESLYRWFDKLNVPNEFRVASQIRLSADTQDDTKIDCTATIEQWFVPKTS